MNSNSMNKRDFSEEKESYIRMLRVTIFKLIIISIIFQISSCESLDEFENNKSPNTIKTESTQNNEILVLKDLVKIKEFNFINSTVTVVRFDILVGWLNDINLQNKELLKQSIQVRNTERLEIVMLKLGSKVTEREKVNKILSEIKFSMTGLTESQAIKIGKMLNSDYVVFGNISNYGYIDTGRTLGIDIGIKAVSINSGTIVFQGMISGRLKGGLEKEIELEYEIYNSLYKELKSIK